jgi:hypothetical protein
MVDKQFRAAAAALPAEQGNPAHMTAKVYHRHSPFQAYSEHYKATGEGQQEGMSGTKSARAKNTLWVY